MEEFLSVKERFRQLRKAEDALAAKSDGHESSVLGSFFIPAANASESESPEANVHAEIIKEWVTQVSELSSLEPCMTECAAGSLQDLQIHTEKVLEIANSLSDSRHLLPTIFEAARKEHAELQMRSLELHGAGLAHFEASVAACAIDKRDVYELKVGMIPVDIIKYCLDAILILMQQPLEPVCPYIALINKIEAEFLKSSYEEGKRWLANIMCMQDLSDLVHNQIHAGPLNAETFELLEPYLRYDPDPKKNWSPWPNHSVIDPIIARKASGAAEGWARVVHSLASYYEALKPWNNPEFDSLRLSLKRNEHIAPYELSSIKKKEAGLFQALIDGHEILEKVQAVEELDDDTRSKVTDLAAALAMPFTLASLHQRERIAYLASYPSIVQLDVMTMDGETVRVDVDPRQTCIAIKHQIVEQKYIPINYQKLFLEASELLDGDVIADYPDMGRSRKPECMPLALTLVLCGDLVTVREEVERTRREVHEEAKRKEAEAKDAEAKKKVNEVFERFDVNGDGRISSEELATLLREVDPGTWNNAKIRRLMTAMDADKDRHVDFREFVDFCFGRRYRKDIQRKQFLDTVQLNPTKRSLFG